MSQCYLYMLAHRDEPVFKIGVTNNMVKRLGQIREPIDAARSYITKGSRQACFRAETMLHRVFEDYRLEKRESSGGTEWFDHKLLEKARNILDAAFEEIGLTRTQPMEDPGKWLNQRLAGNSEIVDMPLMTQHMADVGVNAWAVYSVIQAYTAAPSAISLVKIDRIMEISGLSKSTVFRELKTLVEAGWIEVNKVGRNNEYVVKSD